MNERIQELAQLAGIKLPVGGFPNYDEFDFEKFAELIVRECMDIVMGDKVISWADSIRIKDAIKENFGVEE